MLESPASDKMMKAPPVKKGFHFASDGLFEAIYIEADTLNEAEKLYHKRKKLIGVGGTVSTPAPAEPDDKAL